MSDLEPIDSDIADLFARERNAYAVDGAARDAMLRRIQTAVLLAPLVTGAVLTASAGTAAGAAGASAAAKVGAVAKATAIGWKGVVVISLLAFGGGVAIGEVHRALSPTSTVTPTSTAPVAATTATATPTPAPSEVSVRDLPSASATPVRPPPSGSTSSPARPEATQPSTSDVSEEQALIDTARAALARGRAADALTATNEHAKRFPRGRLVEEREALAIQALALSGDRTEATARASRFKRSFPNSIFVSAINRAIANP